ncbi:MAG TPA: putative Na+/H+ antiporter [Opitutaceae bacterium]|nr:putative Na+/H+ antiporter [Opitutaceae bacterium]
MIPIAHRFLPALFLPFATSDAAAVLPRALSSYVEPAGLGMFAALRQRIVAEPFNAVATTIFLLAIVHTFLTAKFRHWAHVVEARHRAERRGRDSADEGDHEGEPAEVSFKGQMLHFLGEIEAVFGIWAVVLIGAITYFFDWNSAVDYISHRVSFTEPMFVVVIMAIAGTRPVLRFAQQCLGVVAALGRGSAAGWWFAILTVAPVLGSFITEPAAMTIAALLLADRFYALKPTPRLAYATIGLLFVNVSVGGTLTHFAAPPVLMVAAPWKWDTAYLLTHVGWKAVVGIVIATTVYFIAFRRDLRALDAASSPAAAQPARPESPIPAWVTSTQLAFMAFIVLVAHHPPLFIGAFLFFLAFSQATAHHQGKLELRGPLLVGFFLAGLVVHGGLQAWWIEPVLRRLGEVPLFLGATVLTAFNDNAAITYLATLVPGFHDALKYAVVTGAVTGGGLTVIANAPNPAGQNILQRFFPEGISPLGLVLSALAPTTIMALCFLLL